MRVLQKAYNNRAHKLNKIEQFKATRTAQEAYDQLENYARDGYHTIPDNDKKYFNKTYNNNTLNVKELVGS